MSQSRFDWQERIKSVERECWATRIAVDRLTVDVSKEPEVLGKGPRPRDLQSASENLDGTYVMRMFAEFETCIRSFWSVIKRTHPQTKILLDSIGARCRIPQDTIVDAQNVREYRNTLVHNRDGTIDIVSVGRSRHSLSNYISFLPDGWGK